jgi:hypothetical protein
MNKVRYSIFVIIFSFLWSPLNSQVCNLTCAEKVNASMPSNACIKILDPKDLLKNPDPNCTSYVLNFIYPFGTSQLNGNTVDASHIGYTFVYQVKSATNSCWGYITIEDKAPPQPFCYSDTISCFQFAGINDLTKKIIDNCAEEGQSVIEKIIWTDLACTQPNITGLVIRNIRSFDKWGNSGACADTLTIRRDSFPLIKCPDMITLSCIMKCKKAGNTGSAYDPANFESFTFSSNPKDSNYPTPDLLIELQKRDTFNSSVNQCISSKLLVVPYIRDSVFRLVNGTRVLADSLVSMYHSTGLLCKMFVTYNDMLFPSCGNTFKIRREWRFTNWCNGKDSMCVQYISIEDKLPPLVTSSFRIPWREKQDFGNITFPGYRINVVADVHDCFASFCLDSLSVEDCGRVNQQFTFRYEDPSKPGSILIKSGKPGDCFKLPATPNNYTFSDLYGLPNPEELKDFILPRHCYPILFRAQDDCYNISSSPIIITNISKETKELIPTPQIAGIALVCISDETPPTPVCDQITQTTIDPDKCWSRIYAADLDNGSKDNCCNILHFAVAQMDSLVYYRDKYSRQLEDSCGKADYWKDKATYDQIIENWLNCYVFKDYIDVTECKPLQLVLRVYEACGVPRYDDHVFKCSAHDWFCYNTYPAYMLWHNYWLKKTPELSCVKPYPWLCLKQNTDLLRSILYSPDDLWLPAYPGATQLLLNNHLPLSAAVCYPEFFGNTSLDISEDDAPGNTCSKRLYNDCMVQVLIDDKTPPVAQEPTDKFWYCDNVSSVEGDQYEYAKCKDNSWTPDNGIDKTCRDEAGNPYNLIESSKENDADQSDTMDGVGKFYGWYGCNIYNIGHPDEHGIIPDCPSDPNLWAPVYCRSWLILDKTDTPGKVTASSFFDSPLLKSGNPGSASAGTNRFYIWDNCWIDPTSLDSADVSYFDKCGNGWIKRTWNAKDKCGNKVTVDQKITTKHRSDFEVEFPADKILTCGSKESTSPDVIGRPIVMDDECELVGVNYEDQQFDIVPDACFKIVRTWRLVDWCKYDPNERNRDKDIVVDDRKVADPVSRPCVYRHFKDNGDGFMTYVQIIKIKDTIAPVVTTQDDTVCIFDNNCAIASVNIPFTATDNCTVSELLSFRWELDENPSPSDLAAKRYNSSSIDKKSSTRVNALTIVQKTGVSLVTVIAQDNCGNEDTSTFILTIRDCKKPTPYCYNGIATVIMPTTGSIKVWASDLNAGSYDNCTPNSKLKFSFGPVRNDSCKVFECKDIPNGVGFTVVVDLYVWDEADNFDFCRTYVNVQDGSGNVCDDAKSVGGSISGNIATTDAQPVENVIVNNITSAYLPAFKTAALGQYAFFNLPLNVNYSIKPGRNDQPTNGVTTIDLLKIQRHIIGLEPITDPYTIVAADINNDKQVTAVDLIELRKLILNINSEFSNNTSWRFAPKSFKFNPAKPFDFSEQLDITNLTSDELNRDFIGIKIGDINNTVTAHSLQGMEARSENKPLTLEVNDAYLHPGESVTLNVTSRDFGSIQSIQFTLSHPDLTVVSVDGKVLDIDQRNFGFFNEITTASWNQASVRPVIAQEQTLFTITLKAKKSLKLSEKLSINSKLTMAEAFNGKEVMGVHLGFGHDKQIVDQYALNQNSPNPFTSTTNITFDLPRDEAITMSITDLMGRIVLKQKMNGLKGTNTMKLDQRSLAGNGIYYYTLEAKNYSETKKLILMK